MPIPQVTDRIKEAPAVALRAVFAGVGQLLIVVDKIRAQMQEQAASPGPGGEKGPSAAQPARRPADKTGNVALLDEGPTSAAPHPAAAHAGTARARPAPAVPKAAAPKAAAPKPTAPRPASRRPASAKSAAAHEPAAAPKPATAPAARPTGKAKPAAVPKPTSAPTPAAAPEARPAAATPPAGQPAPPAAAQAAPVPGYDGLSIASLRARLRGLDAAGVQALLDYEKANAHRDDVITMFERRLSKIEDEAG